MQTHFMQRRLKESQIPDNDIQVLFATRPNHKAILFVHGFKGKACKTWYDFHELLPQHPACTNYDIVFFGYNAWKAEINASASILRSFLNKFFATPKSLFTDNLPSSVQRDDNFVYNELIIAAHSLGAVISRRALLDATKDELNWATKTKMVLYAPAHKGAYIEQLLLELASPFPFLPSFLYKAPLYAAGCNLQLVDQLKPDSDTLKKLLTDTDHHTNDGNNTHLLARKVILAHYESIVIPEPFSNDPPPDTIIGSDHWSVCKPNRNFQQPLDYLIQCL